MHAPEVVAVGAVLLLAYYLYTHPETIHNPWVYNKDDHMKGGKKNARDRNFGIKDKDFWKWWERQKDKVKGIGREKDIKDTKRARELYDEWVGNGKPKVK